VDLEQRIALVAGTWSPYQQLHPGDVAWHGTGCDGAPPADLTLAGDGWFADAWVSADGAEIWAHFSPRLDAGTRRRVWDEVRSVAPTGRITLASASAMARDSGAREVPGPYFLMQHRLLHSGPDIPLPTGYRVVRADVAGDDARVGVHRSAWAPARIKRLLGITPTGDEPPSAFDHARYRALKRVSIYRPELDLVVLAPDGAPAAYALGWLAGAGLLIEPVGTAPAHARRGLSAAVCTALLRAATELGATQAVVGPRGDDAYPVPRRLYESIGFSTVDRTRTLTWP
jgi:GNAT superfamily N-acetyltransferase